MYRHQTLMGIVTRTVDRIVTYEKCDKAYVSVKYWSYKV